MSQSDYFKGRLYIRMAEDLHLGGMSEATYTGYLRAVRKLADFSKTAPDKITEDQLRRYFLHIKNDLHYAYGTLRVAFSGIKFFYTRTCKRDWQTLKQMKLQNVKSLPEVITREQVLDPQRSRCLVRVEVRDTLGEHQLASLSKTCQKPLDREPYRPLLRM